MQKKRPLNGWRFAIVFLACLRPICYNRFNRINGLPTSVGYGANFHGLSALLTMLNSCAEGIAVVNIDNGFGAGYLAAQINRLVCKNND